MLHILCPPEVLNYLKFAQVVILRRFIAYFIRVLYYICVLFIMYFIQYLKFNFFFIARILNLKKSFQWIWSNLMDMSKIKDLFVFVMASRRTSPQSKDGEIWRTKTQVITPNCNVHLVCESDSQNQIFWGAKRIFSLRVTADKLASFIFQIFMFFHSFVILTCDTIFALYPRISSLIFNSNFFLS
jgi:hypothetical protein